MRLFFDSNVILDYLIPTNSFHEEASKIVKTIIEGKVEGFISAHSMTDIFYISRKYMSIEERRRFLILIASFFQIVVENKDDFLYVLNDENFFDLEDGLQMRCAENANLDYIVTENLKDFVNSKVKSISIKEALAKV